MNPKIVNAELLKICNTLNDALKLLIQKEEAKEDNNGFYTLVSSENNITTFKIGGYSFTTIYEVRPLVGTLHMRTYESVLDLQNYPNKKLVHIDTMDIIGYLNGFVRFVQHKQHEIYPGREIDGTRLDTINGYTHQLILFLKERERAELDAIETSLAPLV